MTCANGDCPNKAQKETYCMPHSYTTHPSEGWQQFRETPYEISSYGRFRRMDNQRILSGQSVGGTIGRNQYIMHNFVDQNGKRLCVFAHRMVAETYIPNPLNKRTVNHIDGDPSNNKIANLEWATHKENTRHAVATGLKTDAHAVGEKNPAAKLSNLQTINIYHLRHAMPSHKLAEFYPVSSGRIRAIWSKGISSKVQDAVNHVKNSKGIT